MSLCQNQSVPVTDSRPFTRREMLQRAGGGFGLLALSGLLGTNKLLGASAPAAPAAFVNPLAPKPPHFAPKARSVIWLFQEGGPSGFDLFDPKPALERYHGKLSGMTDQPVAGLLTDLKRRGLLETTLVIWGGEFGRLPQSQGTNGGRDHNPEGFLMWMAGGGVRAGYHHGATDEIGHRGVSDPVTVPDVHATILHLLGLDHQRLTYLHNGRQFRLTDVSGQVIDPIVA